jgi:hypothetical protein
MPALIFSAAFTLAVGVVFLATAAADRRVTVAFALLAALCIGLDDLVTGLPPVLAALRLPGLHWNWSGKLLSLALSALVIVALRLSPAAVGLTWTQRHGRLGLAALALFVVWGAGLGTLFRPGAADLETLAFQASMPALSEELVFRGIGPAVLLGLVGRRAPVTDVPWRVILATAVVFGLWHGLGYSRGHFRFDAMSALVPLVGSIPGGWLRFKTGSLLVPVLGHGAANVAFHVAGGLVA